MKLKSFKELELAHLNAEVGLTMQIVVRTEGLPENLIKYLESHLVLQIRRNNAILLKDNNDSVQVTA